MQNTTILFRNLMRISEGHLEEFKAAVRAAVDFVEAHGPQLMVQVFIDEERMECQSFQLYRDSDAVLRHWELSDPHIQEVMKHCSVQQFDVYGEPDSRVLAGLGDGATFTPRLTGFHRLAG
jgi:hypothetical protein